MKKNISIISVLVIALALSTTMIVSSLVQANKVEEERFNLTSVDNAWVLETRADGTEYIKSQTSGEEITEAWSYDHDGNKVKVELVTYAERLNKGIQLLKEVAETEEPENEEADLLTYAGMNIQKQSYNEVGTGAVDGKSVKVTAEVTFTWEKSLDSGKQSNLTFNVPEGKTGYVVFTPYNNYTKGYLKVENYNEANHFLYKKDYSVFAQSPRKLSIGFADGTYALVCK